MTLRAFFDNLRPMLLGERDPEEVQAMLGPSPSGTEALAFYREHFVRNTFKIMRELFPVLPRLAETLAPGSWRPLVLQYTRAHPPRGSDPNEFGAHFATWLAQRRETHPEQSPWLEEVADFHWTRFVVGRAPMPEDDGFEQTVFVRQYTRPVPRLVTSARADRPLQVPEPEPTLLVIYRNRRTGRVNWIEPSLADLAVLARRQGLELIAAMQSLDPPTLVSAHRTLIARGVLPLGEPAAVVARA